MDSLWQSSDEELVAFFRHKKTAMSCMKGLDIFLNQLKDDGLLPTEQHEILMKAKAKQKPVYEFLNSLEEQRPQCIRSFWRCVFQEHMLEKYPRLSVFKASLQNGSYKSQMEDHNAKNHTQNQTMKKARKRKNSGDETKQTNLKTLFSVSSSQNTPAKQPKICFPLKNQPFVNKEGKTQKKSPMVKKKTCAGKKKIEKEKPAGRPSFLLEYPSLVNIKEQEKQKKTPMKKTVKNIKTSTETKKTKKEKPAKSPSSLGSNPLKIPAKPKKKTTTNKKSAVTSEKSAGKLKQGVKPRPSPHLKPNQKETDSDLYSKFEFYVNNFEKTKKNKMRKTKNLKSASEKKMTKSAQIFLPESTDACKKIPHAQDKMAMKIKSAATSKKTSAAEKLNQVVTPDPWFLPKPNQNQAATSFGEKKQDMPSVSLFQSPLYVTCGDKTGVLHPDKLARGERSIWAEDGWFTPNEFQKFGGKINHKNWKQSIRYDNKPLQKFIESGQLQIPPTKKKHAQESKIESKPGSSLSLSSHMSVAKVENRDTNVMKKPKLEVRSQHSDTIMVPGSSATTHVQVFGINNSVKQNQICCICKTAGASVSCCNCQQRFHTHCHLPNLQAETQSYKWMCTFCVWGAYIGLWRPMTEKQALDSPVTSYNMQCDYLLMYIFKEDKLNLFADCALRAEQIPELMWLNKVKLKLQNKAYQTVKEFVDELKIIFLNYRFITQNTEACREGCRLIKVFEDEFKKVFNIQ